MSPMRKDRADGFDRSEDLAVGLAAAETMRSAAEAAHVREAEAKKEDEKVSVFWRVFGGTILSMVTLGAITLYNSLSGNISELRGELNKEREARAELVKKDEFNARVTSQYERIRTAEGWQTALTAFKSEHESLKEKVAGAATVVEAVRKETASMDALRERLTAVETLKKDVAALEAVKERLTGLAADLKSVRDDVGKFTQEIGQNRAFDLERKAFRDAQAKQFEESLKEMGRAVQECREKIARLEVQPMQSAPAAKAVKTTLRPAPMARPAAEVEPAPAPSEVRPAAAVEK